MRMAAGFSSRHHPDQRTRVRLPNRRQAETIAFERDGASFAMTAGYYPDNRPGEIFLSADRANSLLDFLMSDAAILASIALQNGAPLDDQTRLEARHTRQRRKSNRRCPGPPPINEHGQMRPTSKGVAMVVLRTCERGPRVRLGNAANNHLGRNKCV